MITSQAGDRTHEDAGRSSSPSPRARIGHVNLKVADLERSLAFYRDVLGFRITKRLGDEAAFLSIGEYHHHICINTWESRGGRPPQAGTTGLFHVAIAYPDRDDWRNAYAQLKGAGIPIDQAVDHGVSLSLYVGDPDQNGVELCWDRAEEFWWNDDGTLKMGHRPMSPEELLRA